MILGFPFCCWVFVIDAPRINLSNSVSSSFQAVSRELLWILVPNTIARCSTVSRSFV